MRLNTHCAGGAGMAFTPESEKIREHEMPGSRLGVGVIGCGVISGIYMQRISDSFDNVELRGAADLDPAAAAARAAEYGTKAMSVDELLASPEIDIVLNLTVPKAHVEVGLAALGAGKHVYSEKPLGVDLAEARRLTEAAAKAGLRIGCAPDTFLGGAHQTARRLLDDGRIGRPLAGTAMLMLPGHEAWHPNPDFYYQRPGGGPALDMGPYYVTQMVNLLGPVARVSGFASKLREERVIGSGPREGQTVPVLTPTHIAGALEFAGGAVVQACFSFDVRGHRHNPLELYGAEGSMTIPDPNYFGGDVELLEGEDWVAQALTHDRADDNYRGLGLSDMAAAIIENRPHRASGDLALHVLEVLEGLETAATRGAVIEMTTTCARPEPMPVR